VNVGEWLDRGIAVIPVFYRTKLPRVSWLRYQHTLPTRDELVQWFGTGGRWNAAIICGWKGLVVLDFDTNDDYRAWRMWAITTSDLARTAALTSYRVCTARGMHVYLFSDAVERCGKHRWGDIKGKGGYVLIPPSVHPSGAVYVAVDEMAPIVRVPSMAAVLPDPPALARVTPPPVTAAAAGSACWPRTMVERIKSSMSILSLFPDARPSGGNGRWYICRCPWHDDSAPSLRIDTQAGVAMCWSGCTGGRALDVIGVYARMHGLDNREAIRELAKQVGIR